MNKYIIYEILTYLSFEEAKTVMLSINNKSVIEHFKKMNIKALGWNGPFQEDIEFYSVVKYENKVYTPYAIFDRQVYENGLCIRCINQRGNSYNSSLCSQCFENDYYAAEDSDEDDDEIEESLSYSINRHICEIYTNRIYYLQKTYFS